MCVCLSVCLTQYFMRRKRFFLFISLFFLQIVSEFFHRFLACNWFFLSFFWCCHFSGFVVAHCSNVFCIFYGTCNTTTSKFVCVCGSAQVRESGTQKEKKFYFTLLWLSHFLIVVDKLAVRARAMSKCL